MALPIFPGHLFNPGAVKASPRPRTIDGGTALNGDSDAISADGGGRWFVDYSDITLNDPQIERWWKQWDSYLLGGARIVAAPILSLRTAPRPSAGGKVMRVSDLYTDDTVFPTVVKYATPYIIATSGSALSVGAVQVVITINQGARLKGGETFSYNHRAYVIERVLATSGQSATVIISPPCRATIPNGSALNFEWPTVQAKLVIGQDLGASFNFNYSTVQVSFVEDFSNA